MYLGRGDDKQIYRNWAPKAAKSTRRHKRVWALGGKYPSRRSMQRQIEFLHLMSYDLDAKVTDHGTTMPQAHPRGSVTGRGTRSPGR